MSSPERAAPVQPFELSGGALCLDFSNSWGNRADPASDRLPEYGRFLAFARQTQLLDAESLDHLEAFASRQPAQAAEALRLAKELREALYRMFSARAADQKLPAADLALFNEALAAALPHREVCCDDDEVGWSWRAVDGRDLRAPLWPIVESASSLLTCSDLGRVSECDAEDCHWLFLDRSRGRSRRWCSMESCGNRAKVRRHYRRHRKD